MKSTNNIHIMRDISYFSKLNRVELFELCSKVVSYNCTDLDEFGTVYTCDAAIINRVVDGHTIHLDITDLRWLCYRSGAVIIDGTINGFNYTERY